MKTKTVVITVVVVIAIVVSLYFLLMWLKGQKQSSANNSLSGNTIAITVPNKPNDLALRTARAAVGANAI